MLLANPTWDFPNGFVSEKQFKHYGCVKVEPTPKDNDTEGLPAFIGGKWTQTWREFNQSEIAAQQKALQDDIVNKTQERLDSAAIEHGYDSILSLCSYATSTNVRFSTEGQYGVQLRDETWTTLDAILAEVKAGTRPMPESFDDIEPELPEIVWPL